MALDAVPAVTAVNYQLGKMAVTKHTKIMKKSSIHLLTVDQTEFSMTAKQ